MGFGKILGWVVLSLVLLSLGGCLLSTCNTANRLIQDANNTVVEELKPSVLLKKYTWFKDASAQLDAKVATLGMYETRFSEMKRGYGPDSSLRAKWSRDDREAYNLWQDEYVGYKASYNGLCADYNSAMANIRYRFCNVGDLPQGATEVLPREYKPYLKN